MSASATYFSPATFNFLRQLARNNKREWFEANRQRYESDVRQPALRFIEAAGPGLAKISREIMADPRPQRGSLMRVYRDIRFSRDKSPYKTNIGIAFGHRQGREAAAPGYYVHIAPGMCFAGGGMHMPDSAALGRIRDAIVKDGAGWKRAVGSPKFRSSLRLGGDALQRAPQGYDPNHPLIDDLRRKDFFASAQFPGDQVCGSDFLDRVLANFRAAGPLMGFLAQAVKARW